MAIQVLPDYMINRLKAGEIVERPASIVKELIENALDAQSGHITLSLVDGGKELIQVDDDGVGIKYSDSDLVFERYATSKIRNEDDLHTLASYGFRGEALASIASVATVTIRSKTEHAVTATKIVKEEKDIFVNTVPVAFPRGTSVMVENLFATTPARRKFLKSSQTEYFYCYQLFLQFALVHYQLCWTLIKNGKVIFDLPPVNTVHERIKAIYKKDRTKNLIDVKLSSDMVEIQGVIGDPTIRFATAENMKFFVNGRPVEDKIIKKAVMTAFDRQLVHGEYPLAILFLTLDPAHVDVNVHPRKTQVKFLDPGAIFNRVNNAISQSLAGKKVVHWQESAGENKRNAFPRYGNFAGGKKQSPQRVFSGIPGIGSSNKFSGSAASFLSKSSTQLPLQPGVSIQAAHEVTASEQNLIHSYYKVLGQLRDAYIILQSSDGVYYVDQHALAERITFEKMKKEAKAGKFTPSPLLQPLSIPVTNHPDIVQKCEELNALGFDCHQITDTKIAVNAVPNIFVTYKVDIEKLLDKVFPMEQINFDNLLDLIFAMRACRASVKAGDSLSLSQMEQLIKDGYEHIEGMFVCQHGRPFFVKIDKHTVDKMFERH